MPNAITSPAEARAIRIGRMRPDGDATSARRLHDHPHRLLVSGVAAAGHVHRGDDAEQVELHLAAERVLGLTDVGI